MPKGAASSISGVMMGRLTEDDLKTFKKFKDLDEEVEPEMDEPEPNDTARTPVLVQSFPIE